MNLSSIIGSPTGSSQDPNAEIPGVIGWILKGGVLVAVLFAVMIGVGIWYGGNYIAKTVLDIDLDPTIEPPGDIRAFDPIATYAEVKAYAGEDAQLIGMSATYVRSDGTLDLKADLSPTPFVTYDYVREIVAGPSAPPIGAGTSASGTQWQTINVRIGSPGQRSYVRETSGSTSKQYNYLNRGMKKTDGPLLGANYRIILPTPTCSFKDLWSKALERGAPNVAVAVIDFDKNGYIFTIRDTDFRMSFGRDCVATTFNGLKI